MVSRKIHQTIRILLQRKYELHNTSKFKIMKTIFTFLSLFLFLEMTSAQIFVNKNASGTNDGSSWINAFTDLQNALDAASPGEQIWIASGKYIPTGPTPDSSHFLVIKPVELYGGFTGTETILSQRDWDAFPTIISGDILGDDFPGDFVFNREDNAHHVLIVNAGQTTTIIDGLIFESGSTRLDDNNYAPDANDIPYNRWSGGAIYIYRSGAIIRNCIFRENDAVRGSCFFAFGEALTSIALLVENVIMKDNNGYNGAGSFVQAYLDYRTRNCEFINNRGYQGGSLFFSNTNAHVEDCVFNGNSATFGGAIQAFHGVNNFMQNPEWTLEDCFFTNNSSSNWGGGINIINSDKAFSLQLDSCHFASNQGNGYGGGIVVEDRPDSQLDEQISSIRITNSLFEDNSAVYGGAIDIEPADDSLQIEILNNNFTGNGNSQGIGGGIYLSGYGTVRGSCQLIKNNFTNNSGLLAGGVVMDNFNNPNTFSYEVKDCLFSGNTAPNGGGALVARSYPENNRIAGSISNTLFSNNIGDASGGAIYFYGGIHHIAQSDFNMNYTDGFQDTIIIGGGAIVVDGLAEAIIERTKFDGNTSTTDGAAISTIGDATCKLDNTIFINQSGLSTIWNHGTLNMVNVTLAGQIPGLVVETGSETSLQNTVLSTEQGNLIIRGKPQINSNGGNISSDNTLENFLIGSAGHADLNGTDPLLGPDMYPVAGSACIDAGNPDGINENALDLDGNPRFQGSAIDAGCFETFAVATHHVLADDIRLKVSPNPVADELQISFDGDIQSLQLMSLEGMMIDINKKSIGSKQINIHDYVPGVYVLWLKSEGAWHSASFTKM
jgi:predicted outer membrane repeat protein